MGGSRRVAGSGVCSSPCPVRDGGTQGTLLEVVKPGLVGLNQEEGAVWPTAGLTCESRLGRQEGRGAAEASYDRWSCRVGLL